MKNLLIALTLFIGFTVAAQQKTFELTNRESGKVKVLKENDRMKIRTTDRKKHVGVMTFIDNETILIDGQQIKLDSISTIKRQPKIWGTVKTVVLITGVAVLATSAIVATGGSDAAFMLFATGSGLTISAGILEAVHTNHSVRKWSYNIKQE